MGLFPKRNPKRTPGGGWSIGHSSCGPPAGLDRFGGFKGSGITVSVGQAVGFVLVSRERFETPGLGLAGRM